MNAFHQFLRCASSCDYFRYCLNRLKQEGQSSQESGMLLDYLDFLIGLPWKKQNS